MELKEANLSDLSQIQCKFAHDTAAGRGLVLVVEFIGEYRAGSLGNPDAAFMNAMVSAALTAWEPSAAIIDLSRLRYAWGDVLEVIFPDDAGERGDARIPSALIAGDECREAIRTLIFGVDSNESLSEVVWVRPSLGDALAYVEARIGAAQQRHAAERGHAGFHPRQRGRAPADARRSAARGLEEK